MKEEIANIQSDALTAIETAAGEQQLEEVRIAFLGKKGRLTAASAGMKELSKEEKPAMGQLLNSARAVITKSLETKDRLLQEKADAASVEGLDLSLPGIPLHQGNLHPLTQIKDQAIKVLRRLGFSLAEGPEIETEFHCFDALNTPPEHPARNEKDTFYFDSGKLLRTHTSTVQVRTMENQAPPVRVIAPGSCYRRDEVDKTHLPAFNQLEGLYVDRDVQIGDLKGALEFFYRSMFGEETKVRFRPHFFPFTEPSFEIDALLQLKGEKPQWIEVAGCGMVDPAVFEKICTARGDDLYDPEKVTGYAFGMGLDRLAMIQWGIKDIRLLIENDARFLSQFA